MIRVLIFTLTGILFVYCSPKKELEVRINNVMCRAKPDINSKIIKIFNRGTSLTTKPTTVEFTFMDKTDVWHEIPDHKCYVFGGLLVAASVRSDSTAKSWAIQAKRIEGTGKEGNTTIRPERFTQLECEQIVTTDEAKRKHAHREHEKWIKEKEVECQRRGMDTSSCGIPLEGVDEDILTCIQQ